MRAAPFRAARKARVVASRRLERALQPTRVPRRSRTDRPGLLFVVPWLTVGGADRIVLDLVAGMAEHFDVHVVMTEQAQNEWAGQLHDVHVLSLTGSCRWVQNRASYLAHYVRKNDISRVVISNSAVGYDALPAIRAMSDARVFDVLHGQGGAHNRGGFPRYSMRYRNLLDGGVLVSRYLLDYMKTEYDVADEDFRVIYNGVDLTRFQSAACGRYRRMLRLEDNRPLVCWIGRLEPEKRPLLALRAAELSLRRHPEARFVFAGDGRLRGDVTEFIAARGLGDDVTMLGPVEDVEHLLADSTLLLLTSEVEGFGLILVEAQAAGVPCIASRVGAVPEVVEPCYGITVPDDEDATGLADALDLALSDAYDYAAASEQARRHSLQFSKQRMLADYLDLLR